MTTKVKTIWICNECGSAQRRWQGSCPVCGCWDSLQEEIAPSKESVKVGGNLQLQKPTRIDQVKLEDAPRISSGIREVDRLLGGGIVAGSLTLIGGSPGIGKSTLMLSLSQSLAEQGKKVLYVCGEESIFQTGMRAERIDVKHENIYLLSETIYDRIEAEVSDLKPDILIIDSIQIVYKNDIPSLPGSLTQVREIAMECMHLAKKSGITTFVIGHVTKTGELAGPRVLEHVVDTVLEFEGDRQHGFRLLRAIKNRFGPTDEVAIFEMQSRGLIEVDNPSKIFIEERSRDGAGSVVVPTLEGSRALLVEVQALVAKSGFATSTRRSSGIDQNRLALLLAVLEKKMGYHFYSLDVFVSIAGGMKIFEPGVDLGLLIAIASSFCSRPVDSRLIVIGEVGLGGEIRSVSRIESRIKEAAHLGFDRCLLPAKNLPRLDSGVKNLMKLEGVSRVEEAIELVLGRS